MNCFRFFFFVCAFSLYEKFLCSLIYLFIDVIIYLFIINICNVLCHAAQCTFYENKIYLTGRLAEGAFHSVAPYQHSLTS